MAERVYAVHKVTGIISEVLETEIDEIPALERATKKQIEAAQTAREVEVYGEPIKDGIIPEGPVGKPADSSDVKATETAKDGTANG